MTLEDRLNAVRTRIAFACERAGRSPSSVRLVAVSKKKPASDVERAHALGLRDFGENYVQELAAKREALSHRADVRWHFIGHLQSNKVKKAIQVAHAIHTLDSSRIVQEVDRRAAELGIRIEGFIEVNLGEETQKGGVRPDGLDEVVEAARAASAIDLVGLMAIPPASDEPETTRPLFRRLRELAEARGLERLSMGMRDDFEVAIEEGATEIRVGTVLFGPREVG
jgi:pyridoxal phosphate enzyme (YggS family)